MIDIIDLITSFLYKTYYIIFSYIFKDIKPSKERLFKINIPKKSKQL